MSTGSPPKLMTSDELFALPDSKKWVRWLVRGELKERRMTKRNPGHSGATACITYLLVSWLKTQPKPRGKVYDGEAYFRIRKDPDTNVGIDVALASAELVARTPKKATYLDGPPILAVEVLSPSDKQGNINDMVEEYLDAGVKVLWVVNPVLQTVAVYRPGQFSQTLTAAGELIGDPELPGFRITVSEIFE